MGLIIAYKFNNLIHQVSRILVLDRGRLVETGTHMELMDQEGIYYKMYQLQNND